VSRAHGPLLVGRTLAAIAEAMPHPPSEQATPALLPSTNRSSTADSEFAGTVTPSPSSSTPKPSPRAHCTGPAATQFAYSN
jgi:hypothetical protein